MALELRNATSDDAELLTQLIHAAFAEYRDVLDPPSGAHVETPEQIREKLIKGGAIIATVGKDYAGCVIYYPEDNHLYLGRLSVLPAFRHYGVGKALVAHVEQLAISMDLPSVQLGIRIALPRNRAFFEALGYRVISQHSHSGHTQPTFETLEKSMRLSLTE